MDLFRILVNEITDIGFQYHKNLESNLNSNLKFIKNSINKIDSNFINLDKGVVVSAGPSLHRKKSLKTLKSNIKDELIICVDGSYIHCLKNGIIPDFVMSIDPHPKRMVRWFGDPEIEINTENDDYFDRQDLDISFRENTLYENQKNIELVNEYATKTKLILSCTSPVNLRKRCIEANFEIFWFCPLVDNPETQNSITKGLWEKSKLPCLNTGGTVGTCAWLFMQHFLKTKKIALVGMDLGYYNDTPLNKTQTYYELLKICGDNKIEEYFKEVEYSNGEIYYTDPTYFWYMTNFLDLLASSGSKVYNCTEGGILTGENVINTDLINYLR